MSDKQLLQERIDRLEASVNEAYKGFSSTIDGLKIELSRLRERSESMSCDTTEDSCLYFHSINGKGRVQFDIASNQFPIDGALLTDENQTLHEVDDVVAENSVHNIQSQKRDDVERTQHTERSNMQRSETDSMEQSEPGFISSFLSAFFQAIIAYVVSSLSAFSSPVQELFQRVVALYHHYQKQGKAPVFLMTVGGLVTLTLGFGYLLQYSFNSLFNDTLKVISGFVIGGVVITLGVFLSKKKTEFRDYAASVIALGLVFNYLTAYFIGPYFNIVSETSGFILLLLITGVSFLLAVIYETRIISALTLIGGVFMPFIVGDAESAGGVFLAYLLILSFANLYLSRRINWPALSQATFFLSLSVIEFIGISEAMYPLVAIALLSGFFYAYTYYWSFNGLQVKKSLTNNNLTILIANTFYFIYVVLQIQVDAAFIAGVFAFHAVVLMFVIRSLKLMATLIAPVYLLMSGLLIAVAVFVLLPADIASIVWAVEGLSMLYIGFRYSHKAIRAEGSVIFIIAMVSLLWHILIAFDRFFVSVDDSGVVWQWVNLSAFGLLSFIAYRIVQYSAADATTVELKSAFILNEIFTFWGGVFLSLLIVLNMSSAMAVMAFVPMVWCFYRASKHRLIFAQVTGYALVLAFVGQIVYGVFYSYPASYVVSQQGVFSWIAAIELLAFMWGMKFYYIQSNINGKGRSLSFKMHYLTFFIPAALLVLSIFNLFSHHIYFINPLEFSYLWFDLIVIGALIYVLFRLVGIVDSIYGDSIGTIESLKYRYILNETLSFYGAIFFLYSVAILTGDWAYNAAIIPLLYLLHRGIKNKLPLTEYLAWSHFVLFAVMTYFAYEDVGNMHFSEQSFATMAGWLEVLLSAWALQFIYKRLDSRSAGSEASVYVRTGVYLLLPVLFIPRVLRLYEEYLSVALWVSFTISWLMYKKIKIQALLIELSLLFLVAALSAVLLMFAAINGNNELPALISLVSGVVIVSAFHYVEKTLSNKNVKNSAYYVLILISPYFYGFAVAAFSYAASHQLSISVVMSGLFLLYLLVERRLLNIMRDTLSLAYGLSWLALSALPVMIFTETVFSSAGFSGITILLVLNLISISALWFISHQRIAVFQVFKHRVITQNIQFWMFHGLVILTYTGSLNLVFTSGSVGVSIALLIHAVALLFLTLSDRYQALFRLSLVLFAVTAVKVIFYDMQDFENLHKVIAFMVIGSILMVAAFLFQKLRNRQLL